MVREHRQTHADGHMQFSGLIGNFDLFDAFQDFIGRNQAPIHVGFGKDDDELLTTVTGRNVNGARNLTDDPTNAAQDFIAELMPVGIVETFKIGSSG